MTTQASATPAASAHGGLRGPGTKACTKCGVVQPVDAYARKRGGRASVCKACLRQYSKERYRATRATRMPSLKARKYAQRKRLQGVVDAYRATRVCTQCGAAGTAAALHGVNSDGPGPSDVVRDEGPPRELFAVLHACQWYCARCHGALHGAKRRSVPGGIRLDAAIVEACQNGASSISEIYAAVLHRRPTSRASVQRVLGMLVADGVLSRAGRGHYRA